MSNYRYVAGRYIFHQEKYLEWRGVWYWIYTYEHLLGWPRHLFNHDLGQFLRFVGEEGL